MITWQYRKSYFRISFTKNTQVGTKDLRTAEKSFRQNHPLSFNVPRKKRKQCDNFLLLIRRDSSVSTSMIMRINGAEFPMNLYLIID